MEKNHQDTSQDTREGERLTLGNPTYAQTATCVVLVRVVLDRVDTYLQTRSGSA